MSAAIPQFLSFNVLLAGFGLPMIVVGVEKHVLEWKRRHCPSCGRAHHGGCRRYES